MLTETYSDNSRKLAAALLMGLSCLFCAVLTWRLSTRLDQTLVAGVLSFIGIQLAIVAPRVAIIAFFLFIPMMGDLRRILLFYVGPVSQDPILLIGPVVLGTLLFWLFFRGMLDFSTRLSRMVFGLSILMLLQVMNPLQGGLMIGLVGLMFFLVPLCWFWIGQHYGSAEFLEKVLHRAVVPVAVAASIFSLYQINFGLPEYQLYWLKESGMWRLSVGQTPRPMAFFNSSQEAGLFISAAAVILAAAALSGRGRKLVVLVPIFLVVVFLQGSRGMVVISMFSICVLWAINGTMAGSWISRLTIAVAIGFGGLLYMLTTVGSGAQLSGSGIDPIVAHHTRGFTRVGESTAIDHLKMMIYGIYKGTLENPVGYGIGSTTLAAGRAEDDADVGNMEVDFSNMFLSLGVVGGVLYMAMLYRIGRRAVDYWNATRSFPAMVLCGLCIVLFPHYLSGQAYSIVPLAWFAIGSLDRQTKEALGAL